MVHKYYLSKKQFAMVNDLETPPEWIKYTLNNAVALDFYLEGEFIEWNSFTSIKQ